MTEDPQVPDGVVLHTDGGSRPTNPGYGGFGIHGYAYMNDVPKKGSGNSSVRLTRKGYLAADEVSDEPVVTPCFYLDYVGSFKGLVSNNVAELTAGLTALQWAYDVQIQQITILADSTYFVDGTNDWLSVWERNGWKTRNGYPVANLDIWMKIKEIVAKIKAAGFDLRIAYIPAHSGHIGNELADRLATIGVFKSKSGKEIRQLTTFPASKYWDKNSYYDAETREWVRVEKHPFLNLPRMMFSTHEESQVPGRYLLASSLKDDELVLIGSSDSQKCLSVVQLKEPEPILEDFIAHQSQFALDLPSLMLTKLDFLLKPNTYVDIRLYGFEIFDKSHPLNLDLFTIDRQIVSKELRPPRKAQWEVDEFDKLHRRLLQFVEKSNEVVGTDITEVIYDLVPSKDGKKTKFKLKDEFGVGFTHFNTNVSYQGTEDTETANVRLTLGLDIPERNSLKRLEAMEPKVHVITWLDEPHQPGMVKSFRIATVIEADGNIGIWAGVYSNLRIVTI